MATDNIRYWGFRIDNRAQEFFRDELKDGRLRMGWGYEGQDLRGPESAWDAGTRRNLRALRQVKKGHVLLVRYLPDWHLVAIVKATEDWDQGYRFDIPPEHDDYGHVFPVKLVKWFSLKAGAVTGKLRASIVRTQGRFWSMDRHGDDIEELRHADQEELDKSITDERRVDDAIESAFLKAFDKGQFGKLVYDNIVKELDNTQWEHVLVRVLETLYPAPCVVTREGGRAEKPHGTDILIRLPGLGPETNHVIAVQVKNWEGTVSDNDAVEQIGKADWWEDEHDYHVIEKVVILTKASRDDNPHLVEHGEKENVRLVFADELKTLLTDYAKRTIGLDPSD